MTRFISAFRAARFLLAGVPALAEDPAAAPVAPAEKACPGRASHFGRAVTPPGPGGLFVTGGAAIAAPRTEEHPT